MKQEEFDKRLAIYEERRKAYERSISLLEKQLDQLDRLLFDRDRMLQQLLDAYLKNGDTVQSAVVNASD